MRTAETRSRNRHGVEQFPMDDPDLLPRRTGPPLLARFLLPCSVYNEDRSGKTPISTEALREPSTVDRIRSAVLGMDMKSAATVAASILKQPSAHAARGRRVPKNHPVLRPTRLFKTQVMRGALLAGMAASVLLGCARGHPFSENWTVFGDDAIPPTNGSQRHSRMCDSLGRMARLIARKRDANVPRARIEALLEGMMSEQSSLSEENERIARSSMLWAVDYVYRSDMDPETVSLAVRNRCLRAVNKTISEN
jgi:hypothetical protein